MVTHGILSPPALKRISEGALEKLVVTNTLPQQANKAQCDKLEEIDISHLLAETIRRSHYGESVSVLFNQIPYDTTQPYRRGNDTLPHSPPRSSTTSPASGRTASVPSAPDTQAPLPEHNRDQYEPAAPSPLRNAA